MASYLTFASPIHVEPDPIKRSRFIGDGAPIASVEEAAAFIDTIRARYPDAGHHCFAWRLKTGDHGFRVHDDGEPGGTGGQPILNHIDGAHLRGVVIVVTRYFGGTKLGKGGLIRAYGGTAGEVIRNAKISRVVESTPVTFLCDYADQGTLESVLRGYEIISKETVYGSTISTTIHVSNEEVEQFQSHLKDATAGRAKFV